MQSGVETINISVLKQYKSEFTSEQSSFKHSSYATFTNGYINHCDDPYIKIMAQKLNTMYASIEKGYSNIKSWWDKYISTYENLNLKLSNDSSELLTPLTDSVDNKELIESLDGDIGGLDSLDTYSPKTSENESNSVKEVLGNFKKKFPSEKKIFNKNEGLFEHIVDKANNDLIDELYGGAVGTLNVFGSGVLRGLEKFTDAGIAIDSGLMYIGGKAVGIFDKEKGKEYTDYAKQYAADNISGMNDVVSGTEIVQNADQFRKESAETITGATNEKVGNFFDKYIYGTVEGVGESVPLLFAGGIAGKCLTGGASLLMKAGAFASLGFADGAGSSFKDNVIFNITDPQTGEIIRDENGEIIAIHALDNTLKSSMLGGLWGGISWGAGTFIGGANFFGNPLANSAARISIDTMFGAAETPVQSGIQTTYNGQSFKETFEANGGWSSVGSGAAMGAFMSACGEAKYLENASKYANLLESNPSEFARKLTEFGLSEVDAESAIKNMDPNKLIAEMLYMDEIKPAQKMDENGEKIPITDEKYKTELDKFARNINGENVPITVLDSAKSGVKQFINNLKIGAEYTKYFLFDSEVANAGFVNPKAIADAFKSIGDKITGKGKKEFNNIFSDIYDTDKSIIVEFYKNNGYDEKSIFNYINNTPKDEVIAHMESLSTHNQKILEDYYLKIEENDAKLDKYIENTLKEYGMYSVENALDFKNKLYSGEYGADYIYSEYRNDYINTMREIYDYNIKMNALYDVTTNGLGVKLQSSIGRDRLKNISNSFESLDCQGYTNIDGNYVEKNRYGVAQGAIKQEFVWDINGQKVATVDYMNLKNKIMNQYGFSKNEASMILSGLDNVGACSYAATVNEIFAHYFNDPNQFYKDFGYPMFKDINGVPTLNGSELLADLYIYSNMVENGGKLIYYNPGDNSYHLGGLAYDPINIDNFGRTILDASNQEYMMNFRDGKNKIIGSFLNSKNPNITFESRKLLDTYDTEHSIYDYTNQRYKNLQQKTVPIDVFYEGSDVMNSIYSVLAEGGTIELDFGSNDLTQDPIYMKCLSKGGVDVSTASWNEGGAHAVFVTGIVPNQGFIVSSWGKKYFMSFENLSKNGFYQIHGIKIGW